MNSKSIRRLISVGLVIILALIFAVTTTAFFSSRNILLLLKDSAYLGIISLGLAFVMIGGGVDLSAGGIVCVVGIICARVSFLEVPGVIVVVAGVLFGALCGLFNGFMVTRVRLTEFVATLASGFVFAGMGLLFAFRSDGTLSGTLVSKSIINKSYLAIGKDIGGLYYITIVWILLTAILFIILTKTNFGIHTYAMGSNAKSAQMSGIRCDRTKALGFVISGACAGLASAMVVANQGAATASLGTGYEFQAIAACVVGGIVLGGGKGDTISAFVGSLFMVLILNGLNKFGLPIAWQFILQGGIIVLSTTFDAQFSRFSQKQLIERAYRLSARAR